MKLWYNISVMTFTFVLFLITAGPNRFSKDIAGSPVAYKKESHPTNNWLNLQYAIKFLRQIKLRVSETRTMSPVGFPILEQERLLIKQWVDQGA